MPQQHDEDCDKVNYEGGICTCYVPSESAYGQYWKPYADAQEAADAANERAMEDYQGPELDW